jgi:anthranilate phosphoribosyltransferase
MLIEVLKRLMAQQSLDRSEARAVIASITEGPVPPSLTGALLAAWATKGETAEELTGAAEALRERVIPIRVEKDIYVDTAGTGGDGQDTFNISTAAALVAAGAGVTVAKHGNRAVSSRCGSADVLGTLGVELELTPEQVSECVERAGIGFLFASRLHPAFGAVATIRRELRVRTLFNLLGPLVNPAGARHQVMGVYADSWVPVVGEVLAALGARHALVVHGQGLDEIAVTGPTRVADVKDGQVREYEVTPQSLGLQIWTPEALKGGTPEQNARILRDVLAGQRGGPRDAVLANAAAALYVAGAVNALEDGVKLAARTIDSGDSEACLARLVATSREVRA